MHREPVQADSGPRSPSYDERVLMIAPTRRDGEVTCQALAAAHVACTVCHGVAPLLRELEGGVGALMMTDRLFADPDFRALVGTLDGQPAWSSVPIVLLCRDRDRLPAGLRGVEGLRNVTLLDRPASLRTMISAVQASLRGRRWQYQIRDQLVAQRRAEEALRRADQRKDEFLATLAHELRNPLAPIKTGLQLLRRMPQAQPQGAEESRRVFDMLDRQMAQLVKLIDELLDVSRIATGKVVLQRERVDLRTVIENAIESSQPVVDGAGHGLTTQWPAQPIAVIGDASRLAQAIGNVLNNAAKYTPPGGRIAVTLAQIGAEAVVTVSDTGVGIPPDMLARVFDLFAQVDRTLDRAQGGLGIGLSLVRSLVALHGGRVNAYSAGTDQGSTFEIRLPALTAVPDAAGHDPALRPDEAAWNAGPEAEPATEPAAEPATEAVRILVVDDNADAADSLALLLGLNGHQVQVRYSASDALAAAPGFRPDAIFCDLGMPGMGGHAFATQLRRDGRFQATLLIAVTGWGGEEDLRRSRAAGFDHHLTKPASLDSIEAILAHRPGGPHGSGQGGRQGSRQGG